MEHRDPNTITIGLVGNPNSGKTTILNRLAKAKDSVGNYPRVTVAIKRHTIRHRQRTIHLVDLPGVYALTTQSPEESVSRDHIHSGEADVIINIVDAGNLERSLFLTTQLIEMGRPLVFALNMIDEADRKGIRIDETALASMLGGPVVKTNGISGAGLDRMLDAAIALADEADKYLPATIAYDAHLKQAVADVQGILVDLHPHELSAQQCRWLAIKLLEGDDAILKKEGDHTHLAELIRRKRYDLARDHGDECEMLFADARYGFIHGMLAEVVQRSADPALRHDMTRRLDALLLHNTLGIPIFIGFLWLMFQTTFSLGEYPMNWIDAGVAGVSGAVDDLLPAGMVHDLVVDGIIAGVGGTIIFLPNIVILFFFMAVFSETGYLTRAAFLMDRLMHTFGLHGKALIPLVMGFGCNVPAVMATRTIESDRSRLITILINPFMLCAARLPVFILFAGAFFAESAGTVVFVMYMLSIIIAMGAAVLLDRLFPHGGSEAFVMELPPYRLPTLRAVLVHMWDKALNFLQKIAGVILVGSIVLWFLQEYPHNVAWSVDYDGQIAALQVQTPESAPRGEGLTEQIAQLKRARDQEALAKSYLGRIAMAVAPVFEPLEFTWKDTVAILTGLVAKEVVVASYAVLYAQDEEGAEESSTLRTVLGSTMSPLVAFAFMVFALLYAPCLATIATIRREAGGWRWAGFSVVFSLTLAWTLAFLVVRVGNLMA